MVKYLFAILIFLFPFYAEASFQDCNHSHASFKCLKFVSNYDGDTVKVNIPNVHPIIGNMMNIRVLNVNTPELRSDAICESGLAKIAKDFVFRELSHASKIDLLEIRKGKYFRIIARVVYDGKDLGAELLKKKMAVPYLGGKKPITDWCPYFKAQAK